MKQDKVDEAQRTVFTYRSVSTGTNGTKTLLTHTAIKVQQPVNFDSAARETSSLDHFAVALISDVLLAVQRYARQQQIEIDDLEGVAYFELSEPLTLLMVVGYDGLPDIQQIKLKVYLYADVPEQQFTDFCQQAVRLAPLLNLMQATGRIQLIFKRVL